MENVVETLLMQNVPILELLVLFPVSPQLKNCRVTHCLSIEKDTVYFVANQQQLTIVILRDHRFVLCEPCLYTREF